MPKKLIFWFVVVALAFLGLMKVFSPRDSSSVDGGLAGSSPVREAESAASGAAKGQESRAATDVLTRGEPGVPTVVSILSLIDSLLAEVSPDSVSRLPEVRKAVHDLAAFQGKSPSEVAGDVVELSQRDGERDGPAIVLFQALCDDSDALVKFVANHTDGNVKRVLSGLYRSHAIEEVDPDLLEAFYLEDTPGRERCRTAAAAAFLIVTESGPEAGIAWVKSLELPEERAEALIAFATDLGRLQQPLGEQILDEIQALSGELGRRDLMRLQVRLGSVQ